MAFRPDSNLIEGMLDNSHPGRVTGWVDFYRVRRTPLHCRIDLEGDFHDQIRGRVVQFWNDRPTDCGCDGSLGRIEPEYMDGMNPLQLGEAGDIVILGKGGLSIEWYSRMNGRVVLSVPAGRFLVAGPEVDVSQLPPRQTHPGQFDAYLRELAIAARKSKKNSAASVLSVGLDGVRSADADPNN